MGRASIDDYTHRRAGHCGSGAFRDLLEFHRLSYSSEPLSEGMVFGLSGGMGFHFFELPELDPPIYLVGRTADLERSLCLHLDIDLDLRQGDDPGEGWRWLRDALDRGAPTMVWADIKHLDYLRVRMHNTMHDIVVTGYDEEAGLAFVADNDRDRIESCSLESLAQARNSKAFPGPNRHATWLMDFPETLPDLPGAVALALRSAVANMRDAGQPIGGPNGAGGLDGVDAFAASYPTWPELFGSRLGAALKGLRIFIVKAGTGGAMFRSLQGRFLLEAGELLEDRQLIILGGLYTSLSAAWERLGESAADDDPRSGLELGLPQVHQIARLERRGVEAMERWLGSDDEHSRW